MNLAQNQFLVSKTDASEDALWQAYFSNQTLYNRNVLVDYYMPYSRIITKRIFSSRADYSAVDINDCYQAALIGLIETIGTYNPQYAVRFTTYATHRIQGAVHSALDKENEKSSLTAYSRRQSSERLASLQECGVSAKGEFEELLSLTLDIATTELLDADQSEPMHFENIQGHQHPYEQPIQYSISCELWKIIDKFIDPDKYIIQEHYMHQRPFQEIADYLSISKGRVSQIHSRAIRKLRDVYLNKVKYDKKT